MLPDSCSYANNLRPAHTLHFHIFRPKVLQKILKKSYPLKSWIYNIVNLMLNNQSHLPNTIPITAHWNKPGVEEPWPENHHCLTRALFQLQLDGRELAPNDANHPVNFLGRDRSCATLLAQQVHDVCCELRTCLHNMPTSQLNVPSNIMIHLQRFDAVGLAW